MQLKKNLKITVSELHSWTISWCCWVLKWTIKLCLNKNVVKFAWKKLFLRKTNKMQHINSKSDQAAEPKRVVSRWDLSHLTYTANPGTHSLSRSKTSLELLLFLCFWCGLSALLPVLDCQKKILLRTYCMYTVLWIMTRPKM